MDTLFDTALNSIDLYILLFCFLLGALVHLVTLTGGSSAYGEWASKRLRTKRSALLHQRLGCLIFIDDYFNCLTVGTVMKPVTDRYNVSVQSCRTSSTPRRRLCASSPPFLPGRQPSAATSGEPEALRAILWPSVPPFLSTCMPFDTGHGGHSEREGHGVRPHGESRASRTADRRSGRGETETTDFPAGQKRGRVADMVVPIAALIMFSILSMLYIGGGFWARTPLRYQFTAALGNSVAAEALCWGSLGALFVAFVQYVPPPPDDL